MASLSSHFCLLMALLVILVIPTTISRGLLPENHVAFFIFGDSIVDAGNNNYLRKDAGHANFAPYGESFIPCGETFLPNPTGRFCDGRIIPDFIAQCTNLQLIQPYLQPEFHNYINGVNFASAGAGILNQTDPTSSINLNIQLGYFKIVAEKLREQLGEDDAQELLSNAVYYFGIGGNDIGNLFLSNSSGLTPSYELEYMHMMLSNFTTVIKEVYNNGGRKFGIQNLGPMGCSPRFKALYGLGDNLTDNCIPELQMLLKHYNSLLSELLNKLSTQLSDFKYSIMDYFTVLMERVHDYKKFGFEVADSACCGSGPYNGYDTCGDFDEAYELCRNPYEYVWFDFAHPTERINMQLAKLFWSGNHSITWPYNLSTLFKTSSSIQSL